MPKFRRTRSAVVWPRCCATTTTAWPRAPPSRRDADGRRRAGEERLDRRRDRPGLTLRVVPHDRWLAPEPGALALRELARRAHHRGERGGEVRPSLDAGEQLAVADRREAGRLGAEPAPAERTHLVEEAALQHGA